MFRYFLRRTLSAVPIMIGVLVVTFLLFRVSAGDPAAAVLGKNPSPEELENMRIRLGTDKPLFFGTKRPTEAYVSADFSRIQTLPARIAGSPNLRFTAKGVELPPGKKLVFYRLFRPGEDSVFLKAEASGELSCGGLSGLDFHFRNPPEKIVLVNQQKEPVLVRKISFYRPTKGWTDSQFFDTFREIVSFQKEYPYVRFFQFGNTLLTNEPIGDVLKRGMAASLALMLPVFFGEILIGIVLAMAAAVRRDHFTDRFLTLLSVAGMSISYLAVIIFCQWFFGYYLNWFPVWGWGELKFLFLPVLAGIISGTGSGVRFYRTVFLNEMNREYLRTAAAKGCSPGKIYFIHLLRNAAIPIVTRASTVLPYLFTGSLLLESYFGIPGLGFKGVDALRNSDLQTLKALVIVGAFLFIVINLLTDLVYAWLDPRMRVEK